MKRITQATLQRLIELEREAKALRSEIRTALEDGATVYSGPLTARLSSVESRRPDWKGILAKLRGREYVERVISRTEPTVSVRLLVGPSK